MASLDSTTRDLRAFEPFKGRSLVIAVGDAYAQTANAVVGGSTAVLAEDSFFSLPLILRQPLRAMPHFSVEL